MDRYRLTLQVLTHDSPGRVGAERHNARQHLVEDDAQGVDVRANVNPFPLRLFRRNVVRTTHEQPRLGQGLHASRSGNAEVHDLHRSIRRDHDILGLDVAVHDAMLVRSVQSRSHLSSDV